MAELPELELEGRIALLARRIAAALPADCRSALDTVVAVAEPAIDGCCGVAAVHLRRALRSRRP